MSELIALFIFIATGSFTPGPNNLMVMASSLRFGVVRTVPHMIGNALGTSSMAVAAGFGLEQLVSAFPQLPELLQYAAIAYLLYLGFAIARAGEPETGEVGRPFRWWQGLLFQWINAKGWSLTIGAILVFRVLQDPFLNSLIIAAVFVIMIFPANLTWMFFGGLIRSRVYGGPLHRPVHIILGLMVALSALTVMV